MSYSPKNGGTSTKPTDTATLPTEQKYFNNTCSTLVAYGFFNEQISNDVNAKFYLGITNLPNDDYSLKKMFEAVLTGKKDFSVSDISFYNQGADQANANFIGTDGITYAYQGYSDKVVDGNGNYVSGDFYFIGKRGLISGGAYGTKNIVRFYDEKTEFEKPIYNNNFYESSNGYGIRFNNDIRALTARICFGTDTTQDRIEFNEAANTYTFLENNNARGAIVLAGAGDFNELNLRDGNQLNLYGGNSLMGYVRYVQDLNAVYLAKRNGTTTTNSIVLFDDRVEISDPVTAPSFNGNLIGNADTATNSVLLGGESASYFRDASNINAGTISDARLPDTISSNITGNAATATQVAGENLSWTPAIYDGNGTQFSYSDASYGAYKVGNIVYIYFEGLISGTMSNDNPYVILPFSVATIMNLGNCWTNSLSDPDGNYGTVNVQDHGAMVARGNRAYFRNAEYDNVNGSLIDEYLVFSFSYKV